MNRTEQVLKRVNRYLNLTRYGYLEMERLTKINALIGYYGNNMSFEKLSTNIECAEQLSKGKLILPLKVKGVCLTEGRHKLKYYTKETLRKAMDNPDNQKFPLMLDHEDNKAGKIIGGVDKTWYDSSIGGLRWKGHINEPTMARNVLDGIITEVSVTVYSVGDVDPNLGLVGVDLTLTELSLVIGAADDNTTIEVDR